MLANLAEDRQGITAEAGSSLTETLAVLEDEGLSRADAARLLDSALIVPVLTAHPTEVRRKSMIDHRNRIAALMAMRDAGHSETERGALFAQAITRQIALFWPTRPLRRARLSVTTQVEPAPS